jgi:hypothetical protein
MRRKRAFDTHGKHPAADRRGAGRSQSGRHGRGRVRLWLAPLTGVLVTVAGMAGAPTGAILTANGEHARTVPSPAGKLVADLGRRTMGF